MEALADGGRYAHTLVTDVDIPFVQDGLRDGESIHDLFFVSSRGCARRDAPFT